MVASQEFVPLLANLTVVSPGTCEDSGKSPFTTEMFFLASGLQKVCRTLDLWFLLILKFHAINLPTADVGRGKLRWRNIWFSIWVYRQTTPFLFFFCLSKVQSKQHAKNASRDPSYNNRGFLSYYANALWFCCWLVGSAGFGMLPGNLQPH